MVFVLSAPGTTARVGQQTGQQEPSAFGHCTAAPALETLLLPPAVGISFHSAGPPKCLRLVEAEEPTRQIETSPSGGGHDLHQHVWAHRELSVERAFLSGNQH